MIHMYTYNIIAFTDVWLYLRMTWICMQKHKFQFDNDWGIIVSIYVWLNLCMTCLRMWKYTLLFDNNLGITYMTVGVRFLNTNMNTEMRYDWLDSPYRNEEWRHYLQIDVTCLTRGLEQNCWGMVWYYTTIKVHNIRTKSDR